MKARKTWREKLADNKGLPKVAVVSEKMTKRWGEGKMVIPAPMDVDGLMKQVPKGKIVTIKELRAVLATRHKAEFACPITTGIFSWIAAYAAEEAAAEGMKRTTPYWRTLKTGGELNPKYPGGIKDISKRLKAEGHEVFQKGKRWFVRDYEKALFRKLA